MATTFAQDLQRLMAAWDYCMTEARKRYPAAGADELRRVATGLFNGAAGKA